MGLKIFKARTIIPCNSQREIIQNGYLAVENDRIRDIGPWNKRPKGRSTKEIDYSFGLILPGLFNLHTHLPMTLLRGVAEDVTLEDWLFKTIVPIESAFVNAAFVRTGTELALLESLRFGVTFVSDMYYFESVIADAMDRFGIRGYAGHHIWDAACPDHPDPESALESAERLVRKYKDHPRVLTGIAPHAPYSCSESTFREAAEFSKRTKTILMTHIAESRFEVDQCRMQTEMTPFQLMKKTGILDSHRVLLAHSVWPDQSDIALIKKENLSVVINAQCNAKLASGFAPVQQYRNHKIRWTLGTDGPASNNNLDILSEMNFLSKTHHLMEHDLTGLPSIEILEASTIRAAEAVGLSNETGSLEPEKDADFIVIDTRHPHLTPWTHPIHHLIYSARGADIHSTYIKGKLLYSNGKYASVDAPRILKNAESYWKRIQKFIIDQKSSKRIRA